MTAIIAGGFPTYESATAAMARLRGAGVLEDNVCSFRVNPPGEHDETPIGGDRDKSPGAEHSSGGAVTGAAVGAIAGAAAGAVISPVLGPVAIAGGAGAGAYAGALVGAMAATDRHTHRDEMRPAETLVAVNVGMGEIPEARVIEIFEQCGAQQVERAEGMWADGEWADFDPVTAPRLVHPDTPQRRQGI